jgi:RNA polymerase sigma factor (sigma-70 family)
MQTAAASEALSSVPDEEILTRYGWVAKSLAKRLSEGDLALKGELEQIGLSTLIEVGRAWRPGKQALSSFAYPRVRGSMLDFLRKEREHFGLISLDEPTPSSDSEVALCESVAGSIPTPEEVLLGREQSTHLHAALAMLSKEQRELLTMRYWDNLDDETIAQVQGVHRTTVLRSMRSALDALKVHLRRVEGEL